ncbi:MULTISPECIES: hypothetical protein [unclassified Streptomyces]|uniref:hypothetical protein n=1 Tax=unclassified Streptomyces TaxID=2593676 RepID=UPI003635B14B
MTITASPLVEQQADLVDRLNEVLDRHPLGGIFRLVYAPQNLDLAADEVLVQHVDPTQRVIELRPTPLARLGSADTLHESQTIPLQDADFHARAQAAPNRMCLMTTGPDRHWYDS